LIRSSRRKTIKIASGPPNLLSQSVDRTSLDRTDDQLGQCILDLERLCSCCMSRIPKDLRQTRAGTPDLYSNGCMPTLPHLGVPRTRLVFLFLHNVKDQRAKRL